MLDTQPSARYDGKYPPKSFVVAVSCFFTATATPAIYTLSLHDALPILNEVAAACKERGLWPFTHFNRVHVVPPCTVSADEVREGLSILDAALDVADRFHVG